MKALVLSGGGARGAFQAGVLRRWVEKYPELDYDMFAGTSAGAINASVLASLSTQMSFRDAVFALEDFWRNDVRSNSDIYRFWPGLVPALWRDSVYHTGPLEKILRKHVQGEMRPCYVCATDIVTGELVYFNNAHDDFWKCVLASASFPIFFPLVEIDGAQYSDGAQVHNIPIGHVIRSGATDIHMVASTNPYEGYVWKGKKNIVSLLSRAIDIMTGQMTKSDVEATGLKNDLADLSTRWKDVRVQTVFFAGAFGFNALDFDGRKIDEMLDLGYNQALDAVVID